MTYLDNAATSFPKPACVSQAIEQFLTRQGGSPGRSSHQKSLEASDLVDDARESIDRLFHGYGSESVCFTSNASEALNAVILGARTDTSREPTVLTTSLEHNSVARPLYTLTERDLYVVKVPAEPDGHMSSETILETIERESPRMVVLNHVSNVTGSILDISPIGKYCADRNILLIVDGSQSAGHIKVDLQAMNIPIYCFTGHKGLLGPQGIGGFIIHPDWVNSIEPLKHGGTGLESTSPCQPKKSPEKFEVGTLNTPGIVGLGAAVDFLSEFLIDPFTKEKYQRLSAIALSEKTDRRRLVDGLGVIPGIKVVGPKDTKDTIGIASIKSDRIDPADLSFILDAKYDVQTRAGLHCAPDAHETLQTLPLGTVRFSTSLFTRTWDISEAISAVRKIVRDEDKDRETME